MAGTATTRDPELKRAAKRKPMPHHGRTPAAWTGIVIAFIGFAIGCYGALVVNWLVMGIGAAVVVLALVVAQVMRALDLGAD